MRFSDHDLRFVIETNLNTLEYLKSELEDKGISMLSLVDITIQLNLDILKSYGWKRSLDQLLEGLENE
jgi:hypothetical protein